MLKLETEEIERYFDFSAYESLRAYFGHVKEGTDTDIRTPLFDKKPREQVLDEWQSILEPKLKGYPGLLDFENDLRSKVGPLSVMKPLEDRKDDIEAYYSNVHLKSNPIDPRASDALLKDWNRKIGGLRARSDGTTYLYMKKSTSSGSPYFTKRSKVEHKTMPFTLDSKQHLSGGTFDYCAVLGWRGQEGGPDDNDVKQRVIWMFPMAVNIKELSVYQPLIQACQRFNLIPAWNGNDAVDMEMTQLFDSKGKTDVIICTDFTKFDQHFNTNMQACAQQVLQGLGSGLTEWLNVVYPIKYSIPLMVQFGELVKGSHGMASGSGGTNADETLSHKCLQLEAAITSQAELNPHSMCLGDDGLLTYPGITLDHVLDCYTSHGLEMNESKQSISKDEATYLRRWYNSEYRINGICRGVYSTYRALGKLMGQERFYDPDLWSPEMLVMRSLSIIENVKWHPCRDDFLQFCVKGDKYRLGLDIPGFFASLDRAYESSELAQSFRSYTAGDGAGINQWWVVQALKAMS